MDRDKSRDPFLNSEYYLPKRVTEGSFFRLTWNQGFVPKPGIIFDFR